MHLNKLVMRNFKKYRRAEVDFQDGLTGIVGGNGSGKSTIVEAIAWALYGNRASAIKRDYIRNARAGDSAQVEVRLSLSMGKQDLTIYRAMKGKSLMPEAFLLLEGQRIAAGSKEVDQRLEEMLKISYQDFMKTFYARQKDLDNLLKEGGTGKREYLLKLLGLDDIKENAIERIKSDRTSLDEQKNRLEGALAEIGDVEGRLDEIARNISSAQAELTESERIESGLNQAREKRKTELDLQSEKMRSNDILAGQVSQLGSSQREKMEIVKAEEQRLREVESSKKHLFDLEPKLERLKAVEARLELLEPKRKEHEEISRKMAAAKAELDGGQRILQESVERLSLLKRDEALLEDLRPKESEHNEVQERLASLEILRDRYGELHARLKEETVRREAVESNSIRAEAAIRDLLLARERLKEIFPCQEEHKQLQNEVAELCAQRERQGKIDDLTCRSEALGDRKRKLEDELEAGLKELSALGDLEGQEASLRNQDKDLDWLVTDLNASLAEMRGSMKVQELAKSEAQKNLSKVRALGWESICPTCERPLEGQSHLLIKKYEAEAALAEKAISDQQARIAGQREKIDGAARSRSGLKKAFDDLNARKSRRSALQAGIKSLEAQISGIKSDLCEICSSIETLGEVRFNPQRLQEIEVALESLAPLIEECSSLTVRLEELPKREEELSALQKESARLADVCEDIRGQIDALGYTESEYAQAKRRISELKPLHDKFVLLIQRAQEIPTLEAKISGQSTDIDRLSVALNRLQKYLEDLGFDPSEHEAMYEERKVLARSEVEAQKIRIVLAAEPEIRRRLHEAAESLTTLQKELFEAKVKLEALGYSPEAHEKARLDLAEAEMHLDEARRAVSDRRVLLGVLKGNFDQLKEDARRKKDHEKSLQEVGRRLEVADTTRGLVNDFMDQVLIRVKKEIARTAGEILEEVSGKYSQLKIDDDFNILVEDGGDYYPISRYSGGEIDMIAVSVRVAISEYLMRFGPDRESYSFLILDEVFGSQDIEHREKMIQMLRSLEERFPQIIAISHISDVQGQFDNTIQVVEDEMGNSRVEMS